MLGRFFRGFREFGVKSATRQHSPMSQYLGPEAQHLRSELFTSKRFIPGRRFKFYVLTSFIGSVFGWAMVAKVHSIYKLRDLENRRAIRKAVPFFQAIEDLRFIALEDKLQLIAESVFANKTQEWISAAQERFHYGETNRWSPFVVKLAYHNQGTFRNTGQYLDIWNRRYAHGYEIPNV